MYVKVSLTIIIESLFLIFGAQLFVFTVLTVPKIISKSSYCLVSLCQSRTDSSGQWWRIEGRLGAHHGRSCWCALWFCSCVYLQLQYSRSTTCPHDALFPVTGLASNLHLLLARCSLCRMHFATAPCQQSPAAHSTTNTCWQFVTH